jgi:hypothetical protein
VITPTTEAVRAEAAAVERAVHEETPAHLARILEPAAVVLPIHALWGFLIAEWCDTPDGRLTISAPPRIGKSWICMVWTALYIAARCPGAEIVIACASQDLVNSHGQKIRDAVASHGYTLGLEPRYGSNRADFVEFTNKSSIRLVGIRSQLTGFGATHLLIDDVFPGWNEAHSTRIVNQVRNWYESVAMTRLYPDARAMHTGTRWSGHDVHALAIGEGWPEWRIPAVCDSPDDPLGRRLGEGLLTPRKPDESPEACRARWQRIAGNRTPVLWQTIYQGVPSNEQGLLVSDDLVTRQSLPAWPEGVARVETIVQIDPSTGKGTEDNDTCGIIAASLGDDGRCYLTADRTDRADVTAWADSALTLARDARAGRVRLESNQGGEVLRVLMETTAERMDWHGVPRPAFDLHAAKDSKWARAGENGLAGLLKLDRVRLVGDLPNLVRELKTWSPGDESPGALDAAAHAAIDLVGRPLPDFDPVTASSINPDDY